MKKTEIPQFGMLNGIRMAFSAVSAGGPFCGSMFADHGADVIWLEPANSIPIERSGLPLQIDQDRRNMRSLKLDIKSEEGKKVFLKLVETLDIFLESSKGGAFAKWGLTDEVLWAVNPKLIILHLNGFGLWGDPSYVNRACYDPIAQAIGGMMYANTLPGEAPKPSMPLVADFYMGLFAYGSALAAYIKMLKTGKGESLELAQYEAITRCCFDKAVCAWNLPKDHPLYFRPENTNGRTAGYQAFQCGDGNYVFMLVFGMQVMKNAARVMGVAFGTDELPEKPIYRDYDPEGIRWNELLAEYCMQHTAEEVECAMAGAGVPATRMLSYDDMLEHPHFKARQSIVKIESATLDHEVYVSNVYPRAVNNPGMIWRKCPAGGEDTTDILEEIGYTADEISTLLDAHVCAKPQE